MVNSIFKKINKKILIATIILITMLLVFVMGLKFNYISFSNNTRSKEFNLAANANGYYEMQSDSLLSWLKNNDNLIEGYYEVTVSDQTYNVHLYVLDGNQTFSEDQTFGDEGDVSDGTNYAQNMVAVKVNGNLTIDEGIKVTTYSNSYGGPKGFTLYVTGDLENNGTITMTGKGAYAEGQDVYLWYNADGTYEYVPATGGAGGAKVSGGTYVGKTGTAGTGRQTGGGGSGAVRSSGTGGAGGTGTSYSGGSGGGATRGGTATAGSSVGGAGGNSYGYSSTYTVSTGVGNPAGTCLNSYCGASSAGTGGLLVIYADGYENNGTISSNGVTATAKVIGGGSSGGGSINIFTNEPTGVDQTGVITLTRYNEMLGTTSKAGGSAVGTKTAGGAGGTGTVNIGEIRNGQYYDLTEIIEQDKTSYTNSVTIVGTSILKILEREDLTTGYYNFSVNGEDYPVHLYLLDGDQTFSEDQTFGDANDVSDGTNYAQNMVIVKVKGNLTINEDVKVTAYSNSYGGPKGFTLYVTGNLENNGTITMTGKGAFAEGQDVYLWYNADETYEYVPATGGAGGAKVSGGTYAGKAGTAGTGRQTGGGGSGAVRSSGTGGAGGTGTSYSGGSGGGATRGGTATAGSNVGGAGGNSHGYSSTYTVSTGVGNPAGTCLNSYCGASSAGTGGLLVIYADGYENNGTISSNGVTATAKGIGGGSSGGGSINIFTNEPTGVDQTGVITLTRYNEMLGTTSKTGGSAVGSYVAGGTGGTGTVNIGEIRNGQYYDLTEIIEQDKTSYTNSVSITGESILKILEDNDLETGYYNFKVNDEVYPVHLYAYDGNQTFGVNQTFGDENDVSDGTNYAQNMVIVKVNGDLTINEGVTITTYSNSYGGPKGFTLYVTGNLENNGTISMNGKGAFAEGQNVYLWFNTDGTYEYIPATGASGGAGRTTVGLGNAGIAGTGRQTGGGGSGAVRSSGTGGAGGTGTSYSGGSGGGATRSGTATTGSNVGGAGGNSNTTSSNYTVSTGVGNPSGTCTTSYCTKSSNGTGGLLVIYADGYENNGTITSTGVSAGSTYAGGGSSGGGSINIFTNQSTGVDQTGVITETRYNEILGTTTYSGGSAIGTNASYKGGAGGTGTVNIGEVRNGQYYDLKEIIEQDKESYANSVSITGDSILQILEENNLETGYYNFAVNEEIYPVHLYVLDGDQTFSENQVFGDENDVSDGTNYAQNMVIVKVNGNLTINEDVNVTAYSNSYGGPKGFTLYVTGDLENNGTITMTAKGAFAEGQNVYLWLNADGTYEYVPALGGAGGAKLSGTTGAGKTGTAGTGRQTGGGGSGSARSSGVSGAGGSGTSYSGGTGGGAARGGTASSGSNVGGAGGNGTSSSSSQKASTGVGNPSGTCLTSYCAKSSNGTGGLLVIYARDYINNGTVSSNGVAASAQYNGGGSSGGGSINIFYAGSFTKGTATYSGGTASGTTYKGGAGGTGTITYTRLVWDENLSYPTLESLTSTAGTLNPEFTSKTFTYDLYLDPDDTTITFDGKAISGYEDAYTITGLDTYTVPVGESTYNIVVTSELGYVNTYVITAHRDASSYPYLQDIQIDGTSIPDFSPTQFAYTVEAGPEQDLVNITTTIARPSQTVYGEGEVSINTGTTTHIIEVLSEDGSTNATYTITFKRGNSSKLKALNIPDAYSITPEFDTDTTYYEISIPESIVSLEVEAIPYDSSATVTITGNGYIKPNQGATITITVTQAKAGTTVYKVIASRGTMGQTSYEYYCTGEYQEFEAPTNGYYKVELWGASGGYGHRNNVYTYRGGYGAYTTGTIYLKRGETFYVYVGCQGSNGGVPTKFYGGAGGWNGGAAGGDDSNKDSAPDEAGGGGGATDIRLVATSDKSAWNEFESLQSRIMVAAGGAGGTYSGVGYAGGLYTNQTNTYSFGLGQTGYANTSGSGGGGGGYFGGISVSGGRGYGGTSYVSGLDGLYAITESSTSGNITLSQSSEHYSGYTFTDTQALSGDETMPSTAGGYTTGNNGHGYAIITYVGSPNENNFLSSISLSVPNEDGTSEELAYTPEFNHEVLEYYVTVETEVTEVTVTARPEDNTATISGLGTYDIPAGTTDIPITVTAENGDVNIYHIYVSREADTNPYPLNIVINGLVPSLCEGNESFCTQTPEFDPNVYEYTLTVPSRIKQLYFDVSKSHPYQTVIGDGKTTLEGGENKITIEVTSEDEQSSVVYTYYVTRDMTGNTDLSVLEIVDPAFEINYDPDILTYYLSVPNEYTQINEMNIKTDDENASYIVVGNENFVVGMNYVYIIVTAQNGETATYTLCVYRERSSNVYLSDLQVINGETSYDLSPEFTKIYTGVYQTTVDNDVTKIEIVATPEADTTSVSNVGEKELVTGTNTFNIVTTAEDGTTEIYTLEITRKKNSNVNLSNIEVLVDDTAQILSPTFDKETLEYKVEVPEGTTKVTINATPEVETTTYKLLDNSTIKVGNNVKRVMSIAEDGTTQTYVINIVRNANSNNYLSDITIDGESLADFDKETLEYNITVSNDVTKLVINGIKANELATISGNGTYYLNVGLNDITLKVTSEAGTIREYTINVTREPNSNANLSVITTDVGVLVPDFSSDELSYTLNVENTVETIKVTGTPSVKTTTVTGSGTYTLESGSNFIYLTTLAEDGITTKTYSVEVIKDKSDNDNIEYLLLEEGKISPTFDSNIVVYTAYVPYEVTKGTFHIELEDNKATYEIINNDSYVVGENEVIIRVTSESGLTKDYKINVIRQDEETTSNYLSDLSVNNGTLTPTFNKETLYYEVELEYDVTSITVSALLEDESAELTGAGTYSLNVGKNLIVVEVVGVDGKIRDYQIVVTRKKNTEARLSALSLSGSMLSPSFNSDTFTYSVETTENELIFSKIKPIDSDATYEVIGNSFTIVGNYTVTIRVTAADGVTTQDYVINVTRNESNNNNLSSLEVSGYTISPSFNKNTTLYYVTVGYDINSVVVEATPEDVNAIVTGTGTQNLDVGANYLVVEVTSESGVSKSYTIVVTREGNSNNLISNLTVNNGTLSPEFDKNTNSYNITVDYEEESVDFTVILESDAATYQIVGNSLNVGTNIVTILVTAENGDVNTYTFNVTRNHIISALLSNLSVTGYEFTSDFNSYVMNYDLLVNYEVTSLDLNITTMDSEATYEVTGNSDFVVGENEVTITVTSSDGNLTEVYTITVKRQAEANTYLDYLYTSQGDLTPTFSQTTLNYSINVSNDITTIELIGEAVDKSNTVTGLGEYSLETGENVFPITVTSTTGVKRTYYVTVNRSYATDNYLTSLIVKTGSTTHELTPEFNKETKTYNVTVPTGTNSVTLIGTISDTATVSGLGVHNIEVGENTINVDVTSENGDVNTYTIIVTREASTNNYLTSLIPSVGSLQPSFDYYTTEYTLNLDGSASLLSFEYSTEDSSATVTGAEQQVVLDGSNVREIVVTAEDGTVRTYQVTVNKKLSDNAKLSSLSILGYTLNEEFDPDLYEYSVTVDNSKQILLTSEVVAVAKDSKATITKSPSLSLSVGVEADYIVQVTAPDGFTTSEYIIHVTRAKSNNANLTSLTPSSGTLSPVFSSSNTEYKLELDESVTELSFEYKTADSNAVVSGTETQTVFAGTTTRKISVVAEDGTAKIYTITIKKGIAEDLTLASLVVNTGYLKTSFDSNTLDYTWVVPKTITTITSSDVTYTLTDEDSNVTLTESVDMTTADEKVFYIKVSNQDNTIYNVYTLTLEYEKEYDLRLESLTTSEGVLEPDFDPDIYEYEVYVYSDTESTIIDAIALDEDVTISGLGEISLDEEETVQEVILTAENGTTKVYTLNIHRTILKDLYLKDLGLNTEDVDCGTDECILNPTFDPETFEYNVTVPYEYDQLDIYYETMNDQQVVEFYIDDLFTDSYVLPIGTTIVTVAVNDGLMNTTSEYILNIKRNKSGNNNLESLEVTDAEGNIYTLDSEFDPNVLEYTINVGSDIDEVIVNAVPESSSASVYVTGTTYLQSGNNDVVVAVTSGDGKTKNYILHVIKEPEYNSYIKNITVSTGVFWNLTPTFKTTEFNYTTTVSSIYNSVTIEANPVSATTVISGTGEFDIVTGPNIFTLVSTAEDGSTSTYTVTVVKEVSRNVNLSTLIVEEGNISPTFEAGNTQYQVTVDSEVESLTIHAIPEDSSASVMITGNDTLISGDNIVNIIVMSSDKSASKTYQLTVHKKASSNANLTDIIVSDEDGTNYKPTPEIQDGILDYYYTVPYDVEKVSLSVLTANSGARVTGVGEEYLNYGENYKQLTVTAEDGTIQVYNLTINREYNLNLSSIVTDRGDITPTFDSSITEYKLEVAADIENITVIGLKENPNTTVTGSGTYTLTAGENTIEFVVTGPDGSTKTYKLVVTKQASSNNYIESLVIHQGVLSPEFNKETQEYTTNVINTLTSVDMDITLEDDQATYEVIGNSDFTVDGENIITIRVTAEDKSTRDYTVKVNLQDASYFSNRLIDLTISEGEYNPDFDPDINYYAATVANSIDSLVIGATKEQVDATVTGIGQVNLELGRNVFQIVVTSQDGVANTYTLVIYRSLSADATLSSLSVEGYSISPIFNKNTTSYTVEIGGEVTDLNILATATDPNSTINISGNTNLTAGENTITIEVIAPDNTTTKTYKVVANKGLSTNNYLSSLSVSGYDFDKEYVKTNNGPYIVNVGHTVNSILVEATPEIATTIVSGTGVVNLTTGQNIINVQATSESGDLRMYTIIVNKSSSSDSTLENIIVSDGTLSPTFDPSILGYEVQVDEYVDEITVTGVLGSTSNATISGNGTYSLTSSETTISLIVTAENGSTSTYEVLVIKPETYSSKIEELIIKDGQINPEFNKNTMSYSITVPNEITSLDMLITLEDEEATYEIVGNENFVLGSNQVQIIVTSRDNSSTTTYTIYVLRQSYASNYLSNLEVLDYTIDPEFDKETLYYELEVNSNIEEIEIVGEVEDTSSTVSGLGKYSLEYGTNRFYVTVTSKSGIIRTYSVVVTRKYETNNLLLTLTYDKGTLSPEFDPYVNNYYLNVPDGTTSITLDGTNSENSTISGLGTYTISTGSTEKTITVTSQAGEVNTYTITIIREASDDANILNIIPSVGTLDYSNETSEYTLEVSDSDSIISFDVTLSDSNATVEGNGVTTLNYGENTIKIKVTAEDKTTTKEVTIKVIRPKEIAGITPSETNIVLSYLEEKQITYTLDPTDTSYTEVEWISLDESIAKVSEDGTITGNGIGSTIVQIRSKHNSSIYASITVNVINKDITSSVYEVYHDTEVEYVIGIEPKTKLSDFISGFDNNPSTLFVYDETGAEVTDLDARIKSFMTIKLIIQDVVYDELVIAIRGDLNGDGLVTVADQTINKNIILGTETKTYILEKITDVNKDEKITVADLTLIKNYLLGKETTFNAKEESE